MSEVEFLRRKIPVYSLHLAVPRLVVEYTLRWFGGCFRCCFSRYGGWLAPSWSSYVRYLGGKSLVAMYPGLTSKDDAEDAFPSCCDWSYTYTGLTPYYMCWRFTSYRPPGTSWLFRAFSTYRISHIGKHRHASLFSLSLSL